MVVKVNTENYQVCKNRIEIVTKKIKKSSQFIQLLLIIVCNSSSFLKLVNIIWEKLKYIQ